MKSSTTLSSNKQTFGVVGIHLSGPKTGKTAAVKLRSHQNDLKSYVFETFFPIVSSDDTSDDLALIEYIQEFVIPDNSLLVVDCPITHPPLSLGHPVSLLESKEEEILWMENFIETKRKINSKVKISTPYIQRPVDLFLRYEYDIEPYEPLSSNQAPRFVRWKFIYESLPEKPRVLESYPRHTIEVLYKLISRMGSHTLGYRKFHEEGRNNRKLILEKLQAANLLFIKDSDFDVAVNHIEVFDALASALVGKFFEEGWCLKPALDIFLKSWPAILNDQALKKLL